MRQSLPVHHLHLQTISLVVQLLVQQSASPSTIHLADAKCVTCSEDLVADLLELPFGNPNDYARSGHLHSTATVPESSSSLSYLHCITYDESCLLSQRFRG